MSNKVHLFQSQNLWNYEKSMLYMSRMVNELKATQDVEGFIWFLEHEPVVTVAARTKCEDIQNLDNVPICSTNRGGLATYHGPGQRVVYCMIPLQWFENDIRKYISSLEEWIIAALNKLSLKSFRDGLGIGVWVDVEGVKKKIAAIGVRVSKGISSHGFAINVSSDLSVYKKFIPCGIKSAGVTSIAEQIPGIHMQDVDKALIETFVAVFHQQPIKILDPDIFFQKNP